MNKPTLGSIKTIEGFVYENSTEQKGSKDENNANNYFLIFNI